MIKHETTAQRVINLVCPKKADNWIWSFTMSSGLILSLACDLCPMSLISLLTLGLTMIMVFKEQQRLHQLKGVLLCFFTFWNLVSEYCVCLVIKLSTKSQISKSTLKGDFYLFIFLSLFKNYSERLVWTTKLFSSNCDIRNCKSRLLEFNWLAGGGMLGWALHVSKSKPVLEFLYHCISDGNQLFSENFGCHFHFILHVMSDKAAFVNGALICVQCCRGNLALYHYNSASRWQRLIYIYCIWATIYCKSVGLWYK